MKKLLFYFVVLLIAVWIGLKIAADPGFLLIAYQKITVEMPLWLGVIGILGIFIVLYILLRLISNIWALGARIRAWSRQRRIRRAWQRTHRGLLQLAAGEWRQAEKDLVRAAPYTDTPTINYLGAAHAAQAQHDTSRRDDYLGKIHPRNRLNALALGLTNARLQLRQHQYEQALATLQQLQQVAPKHQPVLLLLKKAYLHLEDWAALEILLPALEKHTDLSETALDKLRIRVYQGLLQSAANKSDDAIILVWQRVPKDVRYAPAILSIYVQYLVKQDADEAEDLLRHALQKQFDDQLILLYGKIVRQAVDKQLSTAEQWLKTHNTNANLLLTLGRLCVGNQLWGKARSYFEASIGINPQPVAYYELAKLLQELGETEKANACYRQGLALLVR